HIEVGVSANAVQFSQFVHRNTVLFGHVVEAVAPLYRVEKHAFRVGYKTVFHALQHEGVVQQGFVFNRDETHRVYRHAFKTHLEMEMAARAVPRTATEPNQLAALHYIAFFHFKTVKVGIGGFESVVMTDDHHAAIATVRTRHAH